MKLLIAYVSRNGTVKKCVKLLEGYLPSSVEPTVCDLATAQLCDLGEYDALVLCGAVRFGSIDKRIKNVLKTVRKNIPEYPCALGLCCGYSDRFDEYRVSQLPIGYTPPLGVHDFGGELKPEDLRGFDKLAVKHMRRKIKELDFEDSDKRDICLPEIMPENIKMLSEALKRISAEQK